MWLRISSTIGEGLARVLRSNVPLSQSTASSNPSPVSALVELGDQRETDYCTQGVVYRILC